MPWTARFQCSPVQSRKPGRRAADPRHLRRAPRMAARRPGGEQPVTERVPQRNRWLVLAGFLGVVAVVAAVGALAATSSKEIYERFDLPPWAPPVSLFGPVWTVL